MLASGGFRGVTAGGTPLSPRLLATPEALAPTWLLATASSLLFLSLCQSLPGHTVAKMSFFFLKYRCDHVIQM